MMFWMKSQIRKNESIDLQISTVDFIIAISILINLLEQNVLIHKLTNHNTCSRETLAWMSMLLVLLTPKLMYLI